MREKGEQASGKKNVAFIPKAGVESREWGSIWGIVLAKLNKNL